MKNNIVILDNNVVRRLVSSRARDVLRANLRATGREFWPTAINVLEALQTADPALRRGLLKTLGDLAGRNFVLTLPTEAIKRYSAAAVSGQRFDINEPKLTGFIRDPDDVTEDQIVLAREHLEQQESGFRTVHEEGKEVLRAKLQAIGGVARWPTLGSFLDEIWTVESHAGEYMEQLWQSWEFDGAAPVQLLLRHPAWRLFFDGWGVPVYGLNIAHPQERWVETADLQQLIYAGFADSTLFVTDDTGFFRAGNAMLRNRYPMSLMVAGADLCS